MGGAGVSLYKRQWLLFSTRLLFFLNRIRFSTFISMEASPPSPAPDEDRCIHDHPSSLHLSTNSGRCVCIMCFVKLLSHPSSFLTHKLYVVSELRESLRDPVFCTDFLHRHRHIVVAPICEALLSSSSSSSSSSSFQGDNSTAPLAEVLMDLILDLCGINHVICMSIDPLPLVEDFVHHIVLHLGSSSGLSCSLGQSYTVRNNLSLSFSPSDQFNQFTMFFTIYRHISNESYEIAQPIKILYYYFIMSSCHLHLNIHIFCESLKKENDLYFCSTSLTCPYAIQM